MLNDLFSDDTSDSASNNGSECCCPDNVGEDDNIDFINHFPFTTEDEEIFLFDDISDVDFTVEEQVNTIEIVTVTVTDVVVAHEQEEIYDSFFLTTGTTTFTWWEEGDLAFDMEGIMQKLEITPRSARNSPRTALLTSATNSSNNCSTGTGSLTPRMTPRTPFLANMKRQRT